MLKNSLRKVKFSRSVIGNLLKSEKSNVLIPGARMCIRPRLPKVSKRRRRNGTGVEPQFGIASARGRVVRILASNNIRLNTAAGAGARVASNIPVVAGLQGQDSVDLPTTQDGVGRTVPIGTVGTTAAERQVINPARDKPLTDVEAGVRVGSLECCAGHGATDPPLRVVPTSVLALPQV